VTVAKIRVLVVDDSVTIRRLVSDELAADPAIEVVGTAANGRIALARVTQVNPDLIILDIEMPELDGLATLRELRKTHPKLPVLMFSSLTEQGAAASLEALALGATDYFTKPSGAGGLAASLKVIREELIPEIKAVCRRDAGVPTGAPVAAAKLLPPHTGRVEAVTIGVSTGGPNALAEVFEALPKQLPVPVTIVQHMPPMFTKLLAERLTGKGSVKVEEGIAGGELRPGHAWIAPGDFHMTVKRDGHSVRVLLNQDPPENSCRPAADVLFKSMVHTYGPGVLAVVMTGMGQDGLRGCEAVREAGGQVVVQDEATSVVWGMPGFVAKAGLADRVLPLPLLASEIVRRVRVGREPLR
jgi:two-component system chemotaxis response regulator CheB